MSARDAHRLVCLIFVFEPLYILTSYACNEKSVRDYYDGDMNIFAVLPHLNIQYTTYVCNRNHFLIDSYRY